MSEREVRPRRLLVHVEELRLDGFDPLHRYRIADALERELARLFAAEPPVLEAPLDHARLDGGTIALGPHDPPDRVGVAIARATFRGLQGGARAPSSSPSTPPQDKRGG